MSIREGCVGKAECNEGSSAAVTRESFMGNLGIGSSWLNFFERNFKKRDGSFKSRLKPMGCRTRCCASGFAAAAGVKDNRQILFYQSFT